MRTTYYFFCLIIGISFGSATANAQSGTINFDETWKEFLTNDKISNMSELVRPNKVYEQADYAKYLLMNINSSFCQSEVDAAENLMAELQEMNPGLHKSIPEFVGKMTDLDSKIKAYHSMDAIWNQFLQTKEITLEELDAVAAAKTVCEKGTLAKYSFMMSYYYLCQGDVSKSKDIFENRTLRLTEKTSLRVQDVEGLAAEVTKMKSLFQGMAKLDIAWKTYLETGVSPGFEIELPLFICNPIPNIKALVLRGVVDVCNLGPEMLAKIEQLQAESGVTAKGKVGEKVKGLEAAIAQNGSDLAALNAAWKAFIPDNKVRNVGKYGYEYCTKEPLIRAYVMDGFAYICEMGTDMLLKIEALQEEETIPLDDITLRKIKELADLIEEHQANGRKIQKIWNDFIAKGDKLVRDYESADFYCDNIYLVEDWTIRGLTGNCEEGILYLDKIETFQNTFEFSFFEELECRVQRLRVKIWDCRHEALEKLARIEAPDSYEERLEELVKEYGIGEQPEICVGSK